jgi:hypothetical protein
MIDHAAQMLFVDKITDLLLRRGWHDAPITARVHAWDVANLPGLFETEGAELECPKPQT